jgi:hypothetical protein
MYFALDDAESWALDVQWLARCASPFCGLNAPAKRQKNINFAGNQTAAVQPVVRRFAEWAIPGHLGEVPRI